MSTQGTFEHKELILMPNSTFVFSNQLSCLCLPTFLIVCFKNQNDSLEIHTFNSNKVFKKCPPRFRKEI